MTQIDRRRFLRGALGVGAASVVPGALSACMLPVTRRVDDGGRSVTGPPAESPGPLPDAPAVTYDATVFRVGWNQYSSGAITPEHIEGMRRQRPSVIRWFVEWDLYEPGRDRRLTWGDYLPFFETCVETGCRLVVQFCVQDAFWLGRRPLEKGLVWAKPGMLRNYPADPDASYGGFVRDLHDALGRAGLGDVVVEAFNEADLLWGVPGRSGASVNLTKPWALTHGWGGGKWTGGAGGTWRALHRVLDGREGVTWATSGVASAAPERFEAWAQATARIPQIGLIDLHVYEDGGGPERVLRGVGDSLVVWDRNTGADLPFLLGECGRSTVWAESQEPVTVEDARAFRSIHRELIERYGERYQGLCVHQDSPWRTDKAWWDPAYEGV